MTSTTESFRRADIQGLRALAILLVVAFHAGGPIPGGFVGVDVFFVISGFVITGLLLRQWSAAGWIDFRAFYLRRARRLLPALALVVSVTAIASILVQPPNGAQQQTAQTGLGAMLITANVVIPRLVDDYFAAAASANPLLHTWSLSAEEQYYLVFPGLLLIGLVIARRYSWRFSGAALAIGAVSLASIVVSLISTYRPDAVASLGVIAVPAFYSSLTRAWEFGAGALVAMASPRLQRYPPALLFGAGLAGILLVLASAVLTGQQTPFPGLAALAPVIGTACLLASGVSGTNPLVRGLGLPLFGWIGDRSYSWYLWHWPAVVFGRLLFPDAALVPALSAGLALIPASLSFRYLENPIRFSPRLGGRRLMAVLAASAGVPIVLAGALGLGSRAGWGQEWTLGAHVVMQKNCDSGAFDPERCRWPVSGATGIVLLLGDSQAWAIADGVIPAAARLGLETIVGSHNACAFTSPDAAADAPYPPSFLSPTCASRDESILQYALAHRPRVVVIANQSMAYATAQASVWQSSISSAVKRLRTAGLGVMVVAVAPTADELSTRLSLLIKPPGDRFTSVTAQLAARRDADAADHIVARDNPGTVLFDPAAVLCDRERCRVAQGGTEFYSDQNHLSRAGALLLEPALFESLKASLASAGTH